VFELVVYDGGEADAALVGFGLPGHSAWRFGGQVGVVQGAVADEESAWRVGVQHGVVAPQGAAIR
jgi:hypothetical protein